MTHSFFAEMGGFAIDTHPNNLEEKEFIHSSPRITLTSDGVLFLAKHACLPDIPLEVINDKSKADTIAKGLALLQASWMVIQCIARLVSRLPTILLEVLTLGHVFSALIMYLLWWDKPLDIGDPLIISHPHIRQIAAFLIEDAAPLIENGAPRQSYTSIRRKSRNKDPIDYHRTFEEPARVCQEMAQEASSIFRISPSAGWGGKICSRSLNWTAAATDKFLKILTTGGSEDDPYPTSREASAWFAFTLLSGCYGGLYLAAWFSHFPTPTEALLWRLSSGCVTSAGLVFGCLGQLINPLEFTMYYLDKESGILGVLTYCLNLAIMLFYAGLCLGFLGGYGCARAFLVIESFISLRSLPVTAYNTPNWTQWIPHL